MCNLCTSFNQAVRWGPSGKLISFDQEKVKTNAHEHIMEIVRLWIASSGLKAGFQMFA